MPTRSPPRRATGTRPGLAAAAAAALTAALALAGPGHSPLVSFCFCLLLPLGNLMLLLCFRCYGGQGESLVPLYTRMRLSLISLLLLLLHVLLLLFLFLSPLLLLLHMHLSEVAHRVPVGEPVHARRSVLPGVAIRSHSSST